jgi:hypothetical protein
MVIGGVDGGIRKEWLHRHSASKCSVGCDMDKWFLILHLRFSISKEKHCSE